MDFINRVEELSALERFKKASKKGSIMVGMIGRRQVGKTRLVREFMKRDGGKSLYFFVDEKREDMLLEDFTRTINESMGSNLPDFRDWDRFFSYIFSLKDQTIVFDEFQNMEFVNPSGFSIMQKHVDSSEDSNILLILIGSYTSMMKRILGDSMSPLFGRSSSIWKIEPLDFDDLKSVLPSEMSESIRTYMVFGGMPRYYVLMDRFGAGTVEEALDNLLYWTGAPLLNEPMLLLSQEFRGKWKTMFSILEAVSEGKASHNEIAGRTGISVTNLSKYLEELVSEHELLMKEYPVTEDRPRVRVSRYLISENFLSFWFRFVYANREMIEREDWDALSDKVNAGMNTYLGKRFELFSRELIRKSMNYERIGSWWNRRGDEIDIVALNEKKKEILFGEVKWRSRPVGCDVLNDLMEKKDLVQWKNGHRKEKLMIVSKSGFTEKCLERMDDEGIIHWDMMDMAEMIGK